MTAVEISHPAGVAMVEGVTVAGLSTVGAAPEPRPDQQR